MSRQSTAKLKREGSGCVALRLDVDVASQRHSASEARAVFFWAAATDEIKQWLCDDAFVTRIGVAVG